MTSSGMGRFDGQNAQAIENERVHGFEVYGDQQEKIGKVVRVETAKVNSPQYLTIKIGSWLSQKEVSLPLVHYQVDFNNRRLYLEGWSKDQVEHLSNSSDSAQMGSAYNILETSTPLESEAPLEAPVVRELPLAVVPPLTPSVNQETIASESTNQPQVQQQLLVPDDRTQQPNIQSRVSAEEIIPLLAERVVVDRQKRKKGEIVVRKVIETEVIEVLVRREKLIVEQVSPEYKELAVIDLGQTSSEKSTSPVRHNTVNTSEIKL
jgi:stress response protein YsnF